MTMRRLIPPAALAALLFALGCTASLDAPREKAEAPTEEKPKGDQLHVAPMPRVWGENPPTLALPVVWTPAKSTKPWSELIVGKWLQINDGRYFGQHTYEYTRDGKKVSRYSYPAISNRPPGLETSTRDYRVSGNVIESPSLPVAFDDGYWVTESTIYIESLDERELRTLALSRRWPNPKSAKSMASAERSAEQVVAECTEVTEGRAVFLRLKD